MADTEAKWREIEDSEGIINEKLGAFLANRPVHKSISVNQIGIGRYQARLNTEGGGRELETVIQRKEDKLYVERYWFAGELTPQEVVSKLTSAM